jgi:hypothetical protein
MTKDEYKNITNITWTAKGKIAKVQKTDGSFAEYRYDGMNNRIFAHVYTPASTGAGASTPENTRITHYVRDASGNVLGLYEEKELSEFSIYGSSRAGTSGKTTKFAQTLGTKKYEFSNHLGNVLAVVSDNKFKESSGNYAAHIISERDYYAFGKTMQGRNFQSTAYCYGFNGKENFVPSPLRLSEKSF